MNSIDEIRSLIKSGAIPMQLPAPNQPPASALPARKQKRRKPKPAKSVGSILDDSESDDEDENIWEPAGSTKDTINSLSYFTLNGDTWPQLKAKEKKKSLLIFFNWLDDELQKIADAEVAAADELFN
jgi:hypothetical protein